MNFTTRQDVEAPIAFVWKRATDFTAFERQGLRRGAEVRRRDTLREAGVGAIWDAKFTFRGKERALTAQIVAFDPPNTYTVQVTSGGITGLCLVDLVALSRGRTRLTVAVDLSASSLSARLLLQSLKLARGSLNKRFADRIEAMAQDMQDRYRRQQAGA